MAKNTKTNAMRMLERARIAYETREYEYDEGDLSGTTIAKNAGLDPEMVFKTLVAKGDKTGIIVMCIPVEKEVDLKKAASVSGVSLNVLHPLASSSTAASRIINTLFFIISPHPLLYKSRRPKSRREDPKKCKSPHPIGQRLLFFDSQESSTHLVQFQGQLALLSVGGILSNNTLSNSLVNLLYGNLVSFGSSSLITGLNSGVELLDQSLDLTLQNFVLQGLGIGNQNSLLSRLDIGHWIHLLVLIFQIA
jgi:hypothetical protein